MPRFITKKNICNCWVSLTLTVSLTRPVILKLIFPKCLSILAQRIANALANGVN